jgi:hypothetical protein
MTRSPDRKKMNKKYFIVVYPIVIGILLLIAFFIGRITAPKSVIQNTTRSTLLSGKTKQLNKNFLFPVKNDSGTVLTNLKYQIDSAELQYAILINGQTASAVKGKVFLILNIRLTNDYSKSIQINSRDYIRLTVNKDSELFAPSMHNDPIQLDAISTKPTRLGFAINETDKNLILHIGEIDGKKTSLPISF